METLLFTMQGYQRMINCEICGEPMPEGEQSFRYHGFSGPCPKPPLPTPPRNGLVNTRRYDPKSIPADEPVFVLRAQDALAADLVELWAMRAQSMDCTWDKVRSAHAIADEMRRFRKRKNPD